MQVADGRIAVILDQDIVTDGIQAADGLGHVELEVVFAEHGVGGVDEAVVVDVDVFILRGHEGGLLGPLLLGGEEGFPHVVPQIVGGLVGPDEAGEGAVGLVFDQALVDVGGQHEHAPAAVHHDLIGQEAQILIKGSILGLGVIADETEVLVHHHHAVVVGVGHVDVAFLVHGHVAGRVEGGRLRALRMIDGPHEAEFLPLPARLQDAVVAGIADIQVVADDEQALGTPHGGVQAQGAAV